VFGILRTCDKRKPVSIEEMNAAIAGHTRRKKA